MQGTVPQALGVKYRSHQACHRLSTTRGGHSGAPSGRRSALASTIVPQAEGQDLPLDTRSTLYTGSFVIT
jgi:hypothetical protein